MEISDEIVCVDPSTLDRSKYTAESLKVLLEARGFPSASDDFDHLWVKFVAWATEIWATKEPLPWFMKKHWLTKEAFLAVKTTTNQMNQYIVVMGLPVAQRLYVQPKREEIA